MISGALSHIIYTMGMKCRSRSYRCVGWSCTGLLIHPWHCAMWLVLSARSYSLGDHCIRFRFRSSSPLGSSSSFSCSAVSVGLRICAILPRRVGGPEPSLTVRPPTPPRFAEFQDQLPKLSVPLPTPFVKGGGGGVVGLEFGRCFEAVWSE